MSDSKPTSLSIPLTSAVALAIEWWRLGISLKSLPGGGPPAARHALRRMDDFLRTCELEVQVMDGRPFDPGLAVRVVEALDDPSLPEGESFIAQTLSPLVLWRGGVVKDAEVVTRRGTGRAING